MPNVTSSQISQQRLETKKLVSSWANYALPSCIEMHLSPIELGEDSESRRTKREREFAAGRACAHQVLSVWGERQEVLVAEDRSPIWPELFVGSISHSDIWAWSAVAKKSDLRSVGIDTETIVDRHARNQLEEEIATHTEWELARTGLANFDHEQVFTIVFSAKETFYKCWSPLTREFFGFDQAEVCQIDAEKVTIQMLPSNPNFHLEPKSLNVYYLVHNQNVFTATWMEIQG